MSEIARIDQLARLDRLVEGAAAWVQTDSDWRPLSDARAVVRRVLPRVETLRVRLDAPLVVATFGGTGTGKSSLVNALLGEEVALPGRQRPTTTTPTLVAHPQTDLGRLDIPAGEFKVMTADVDLLREIVVIDCPDPDTTGSDDDAESSNLAILRRALPHCDVLIVTGTQQKYANARVREELDEAASGCRLVFVQTHADRDEDIRAAWAAELSGGFEVPDLFFVDSVGSLRQERETGQPHEEIARLRSLLDRELTSTHAARIRRGNVADLLGDALGAGAAEVSESRGKLSALSRTIDEADAAARDEMADALRGELLQSGGLWEKRIVSAVCDRWGAGPFSAVLRVYNGLGSWIGSLAFMRSGNAAAALMVGGAMAVKAVRDRGERQRAETIGGGSLGLSDAILREKAFVVAGAVREADLPADLRQSEAVERLARAGDDLERSFLSAAARQIDRRVDEMAARHSRWPVRLWYDLLFLAYTGFVLARAGKNFFYDSFWREQPILGSEFWVPALIFFLVWTGLLAIAFSRRVRRGLRQVVDTMIDELMSQRLGGTLFPDLRDRTSAAAAEADELHRLAEDAAMLRSDAEPVDGLARHVGTSRAADRVD